jgi:hypothetical protein
MQRKYLLPEEGSGNWRMKLRNVDWSRFWLLECVILAVPTMATVFATGGRSPVTRHEIEVLLVVLVALTVVNLFLGIPRGSDWTHLYRGRGSNASGR